jgi:hypothetical protein
MIFGKSRGTAAGAVTTVQAEDNLGSIYWAGADGTSLNSIAAKIDVAVDGTPGTNDMPGRIVFSTTADGANTSTERMRITSTGNVGIGTGTPSSGLTVAAPIGTPSGNGVFLGTDGTYSAMQLNGSAGAYIDFSTSGTDFKGRTFYDNTTNFMSLYTNAAERMRLGSDGAMYLGTTTNPLGNSLGQFNVVATVGDGFNIKHTVNGNNLLNLWQTGTTDFAAIAFYKGNTQDQVGNITCSTFGTTYNTTSDYRLKENVLPMTGALSKVAALKPCTYTWKVNGSAGQGFIAHELQEVIPDCVTGVKDAVDEKGNIRPQGVDTSFLVATLVAAIQEQQTLIAQLQTDIETLKGN